MDETALKELNATVTELIAKKEGGGEITMADLDRLAIAKENLNRAFAPTPGAFGTLQVEPLGTTFDDGQRIAGVILTRGQMELILFQEDLEKVGLACFDAACWADELIARR